MRATERKLRKIIKSIISESSEGLGALAEPHVGHDPVQALGAGKKKAQSKDVDSKISDDDYEYVVVYDLGGMPQRVRKSELSESKLRRIIKSIISESLSSCASAEDEILTNSIGDVKGMLSVYGKNNCEGPEMKASFMKMLDIFGYEGSAFSSALKEAGLVSEPHDDHDPSA